MLIKKCRVESRQAKQSHYVATKETYSVFKMVEPVLSLLLLLLSLKERGNKKFKRSYYIS